MKDVDKDTGHLIDELGQLRQRIAELEASEAKRKWAEEALKVSETKYRAVVENANEIIVVIQDNISKYSNPKAAELTGYSQEELTSRPFLEFVHPDDRQIAVENYSKRLRGDRSTPTVPVRILGKDGNIMWTDVSDSEFTWEGKPALLYLVNDVTEWKKTQEALLESETKHRELAESITDVFFAMDVDLRYTYWNKASEELTGILAKEALGKSIYDIFPDDEATRRAEEVYRRTLATKKPQHFINNFPIGGKDLVFEINTYPTREGLCVYVRDLTQYKKLEEALSESELWYRHVFDNAPFGIGFTSIDGKVINLNKTMETITGYSAEEFSKVNLTDTYVNKADREPLLKELRRQGNVVDYSVQLRRKDGTTYDALLSVRLTTIGDREFIQTICHDVTERTRAEEALLESERRYRELFENAVLAIFQSTPDGKVIAVNPEFARMFGYESPEDVLTSVKNIATDLFVDPQRRLEILRLIAEDQNLSMFENLYRRKDGGTFFGKLNVRQIADSDGRVLYLEGFVEDISEHKRAEEALRESEERYRALVELSPEAIFVASEGKHVFINSAGLKLFGASSPDQIIGKPVIDVIHPDYREIVAERMQKALETGMAVSTLEEKFLRLDGAEIDVEVRAAPLIYRGKPAMQAVVRDISGRKQAAEALRLSEQNFRDSIESSPLGIRIIDKDGKVLYANRALLDIYGYSSSKELEAVPRKQLYTPESYVEHKKRVRDRKLGDHVPPNYEISIVRKDGQVRELAVSRSEVRWNGEKQFQVIYQDITERKLAEEVLRQREEHFRALIENSADVITIVDSLGIVKYESPNYKNIWGRDPIDEIGGDIFKNVHPDDMALIGERFEYILMNPEDTVNLEVRGQHGDGSWRTIEIVARNLLEHPAVCGIVVNIRDVTERKWAQEALRESEAHYRLLAENVRDVIWTMDINLKMTYISPSCINLHGYTPEEAINIPLEKGITRESYDSVIKIVTEALADEAAGRAKPGIMRSFEAEFICKDGGTIWTETIVTFIRDEVGKAIGIQGVTRNIDARKQAEEALRESEAQYRLLAENVRDVIWATDMDLRFTYVSPSVKYLGGRTAEEVMSLSLLQLLSPSSQELATKTFAEELVRANTMPRDTTASRTLEVEILRRDGSTYWAEMKMSFMPGPDGRPIGILGIMRDITERRKAEEDRRILEQKAQLASRLASVGELASGVAHEINNPLTGVIGYAELLMQEDVPQHIKNDLEVIHNGAQRVAEIVKGLLRFARQTKPERTVVDINEVIEICLRLRAYEMETSNIKVVTNLAPDLPLTVADAGQLQQVFLNLLINAEMEMRLAHGKGRLIVKTETVDNKIRISLKDDGPGIAIENLEKIFDPFFTTREVGKGTGLGLSICHGIISEHGGRIWAESQLGKGATFIVELSIITEEKRPRPLKTARKPQKATKSKILVVDDEPVVRQLLTEMLTAEGHEVDTTDDGKDALNRIKKNGYSLILLDIKLPGLSGSELYERIQEISLPLTKRVVFMTGDVMAADTGAFLTRTRAPFITKPFNVRQLKAEINRLLTTPRPKGTAKSKLQVKNRKQKSKAKI